MSCWHTHSLTPCEHYIEGSGGLHELQGVRSTDWCSQHDKGSPHACWWSPPPLPGALGQIWAWIHGQPWVRFSVAIMPDRLAPDVRHPGLTDTWSPPELWTLRVWPALLFVTWESEWAIVWVCLCIRPFFIWLCFSLRTQAHTCVLALVFMHIFFLYSSLTSVLIC